MIQAMGHMSRRAPMTFLAGIGMRNTTRLTEPAGVATHRSRLARLLDGKERAREVKADTSWFAPAGTPVSDDDG